MRSRCCWTAPSARTGKETGAWCRPGPTGCPAAASYLRRPGDSQFRAFKLDVLRAEAGLIAEITTFGPDLFPAFGLGETL